MVLKKRAIVECRFKTCYGKYYRYIGYSKDLFQCDRSLMYPKQVLKLMHYILGCVAQSVTCMSTDASLTADPGVASSIPALPILSWRLIMK